MHLVYYITILFTIFFSSVYCQSNLKIGEWKSHLSFKAGISISQSEHNIIYASDRGIILINKETLTPQFLSKEDGLNDIRVKKLYYDQPTEALYIIYEDSNIDIIRNDAVINIPFIRENNIIIGSKIINNLFFYTDGEVLFSSDFGIVGFDSKRLEFTFTTFTQERILHTVKNKNIYYASTPSGLYTIDGDKFNILDFSLWRKLGINEGLPNNYTASHLFIKDGKLHFSINNTLYVDDDGVFLAIYTHPNTQESISFIRQIDDEIVLGIRTPNNQSYLIEISTDMTVREGIKNCTNNVLDVVKDEKGRYWYADLWDPIKYSASFIDACSTIRFNVPFANIGGRITFEDDRAYISSGGVTEDFQYANTIQGFYVLDNRIWKNYNLDNIPEMRTTEFFNIQNVLPFPDSEEIAIGSYFSGLMLYDPSTQMVKYYTKDDGKSSLQPTLGDLQRTRISGLAFDKNKNLWISNYGAQEPLSIRTPSDEWQSYALSGSKNTADIVIDDENNKWIIAVGLNGGVIVFNEGQDIKNTSDDKIRFINRSNSQIPGDKINSICIDLDQNIWIGTNRGPIVFRCSDPYNNGNCPGRIPIVTVDGIGALLLKDEDILSIEVDGANRKWFGTRNGIFIQSADGTENIDKLDTKNSPLLDNRIIDLAYNPTTGEMFILTGLGIQSFKTETTGAKATHDRVVTVFPNPVRPDYSGPIAIKGLARDANVKITDVNGRLVFETQAFGGQAIWDGRDYNGIKAATGVYLVFSSAGSLLNSVDTHVTKILIVN